MKQCIEFKHQGTTATATIIANKGLCWLAELMDGSTTNVQKKHVLRQWEEEEEDAPPPSGPSLATLVQELTNAPVAPQPVAKRAKEAKDTTNLVTLKQLCFDEKIEPRIARRRLRKAMGQVGTGSRWEWEKGSDMLEKVRAAIRPAATEPTEPAAE